jgi:hypothetical protein
MGTTSILSPPSARYFTKIFASPQQMPPNTAQFNPIKNSPSLTLTKPTAKQAPAKPHPNQFRITTSSIQKEHSQK